MKFGPFLSKAKTSNPDKVLPFESLNEILKCDLLRSTSLWCCLLPRPQGAFLALSTLEGKSSLETRLIMLYNVVHTFEFGDEIFKCFWVVLSFGGVCYAVQHGPNFWGCKWSPKVRQFNWCRICSPTLTASSIVLVLMGAVLNTYCSVMDRAMPRNLWAIFWRKKKTNLLYRNLQHSKPPSTTNPR